MKCGHCGGTGIEPVVAEYTEDDSDLIIAGSCPDCGHQWADHHERDGCGACAFTFVRSCKQWPEDSE